MDAKAYAHHLRRDGFQLADVAEGHLDATVPSCPDWKVADLVWHTGEVHDFWGQVAAKGLQDRHEARAPERPSDLELLSWFREGVERLAEILQNTDPAREVWTWSSQKNVGFVQRRMAQETAVHRWDGQAAAGVPEPIDAELAVDGVDEFLDLHMPADANLDGDAEAVHLHSTDAAGEWVVEVRTGGLGVRREHGKGDAAVRASASDLLLLLWRRIGPDDVEVLGDRAALKRFLARTDLN
ncbi:MAG: maleylpyruvate isomerase family mycothiol-dependent enzyme [Actinomycetota bacterium]